MLEVKMEINKILHFNTVVPYLTLPQSLVSLVRENMPVRGLGVDSTNPFP